MPRRNWYEPVSHEWRQLLFFDENNFFHIKKCSLCDFNYQIALFVEKTDRNMDWSYLSGMWLHKDSLDIFEASFQLSCVRTRGMSLWHDPDDLKFQPDFSFWHISNHVDSSPNLFKVILTFFWVIRSLHQTYSNKNLIRFPNGTDVFVFSRTDLTLTASLNKALCCKLLLSDKCVQLVFQINHILGTFLKPQTCWMLFDKWRQD